MRSPGEKYLPWEIYRTFEPAFADGSARLSSAASPRRPPNGARRGRSPSDMIYLTHMTRVTRAATASDLERCSPTAARRSCCSPRIATCSRRTTGSVLAGRFDDRFLYESRDYTTAAVDTDLLLRQHLGGAGAGASPYLSLVAGAGGDEAAAALPVAFVGGFALRVTPPLPEDCLLTVTIRRSPDTAAAGFRPAIRVDGIEVPDPWPVPMFDAQRVSVLIPRDPGSPRQPRRVRIDLERAGAARRQGRSGAG